MGTTTSFKLRDKLSLEKCGQIAYNLSSLGSGESLLGLTCTCKNLSDFNIVFDSAGEIYEIEDLHCTYTRSKPDLTELESITEAMFAVLEKRPDLPVCMGHFGCRLPGNTTPFGEHHYDGLSFMKNKYWKSPSLSVSIYSGNKHLWPAARKWKRHLAVRRRTWEDIVRALGLPLRVVVENTEYHAAESPYMVKFQPIVENESIQTKISGLDQYGALGVWMTFTNPKEAIQAFRVARRRLSRELYKLTINLGGDKATVEDLFDRCPIAFQEIEFRCHTKHSPKPHRLTEILKAFQSTKSNGHVVFCVNGVSGFNRDYFDIWIYHKDGFELSVSFNNTSEAPQEIIGKFKERLGLEFTHEYTG